MKKKIEIEEDTFNRMIDAIGKLTQEIARLRQATPQVSYIYVNPPQPYVPPIMWTTSIFTTCGSIASIANTYGPDH